MSDVNFSWPEINWIMDLLIHIQNTLDPDETTDVRLQVYENGKWVLRVGLSDYDQDHRGYWGASSVNTECTQENIRSIAESLLEQAQDQKACGGDV